MTLSYTLLLQPNFEVIVNVNRYHIGITTMFSDLKQFSFLLLMSKMLLLIIFILFRAPSQEV